MDRCVVIVIFFVAADGWCAEIIHRHGSQHNIVCNHYLWEYPVLIPGILSKKKGSYWSDISVAVFLILTGMLKGYAGMLLYTVCFVNKNDPG